jgi:hypothetical protein
MFDRVGKLAEQTATGLSRRAFLTRLGQGAMSVAALVATAGFALAGTKCVLNGGCCSGAFPYQIPYKNKGITTYGCCANKDGTNCALCTNAACCNGGGYCNLGVTCCSDIGCNTPC